MRNFNVIGAGKVGTALALLFIRSGLELEAIHSRTKASAEKFQEILGGGNIAQTIADLPAADITIIATSDSSITDAAQNLAAAAHLKKGSIVFHCSGALPSSLLSVLHTQGVFIASVHPAKSFTNAQQDADHFSGTHCGMEGDEEALVILSPLFQSFGAHIFRINPDQKTLYHAGTVMACNYLAPLMEAAMQCHADAGIDAATSWNILEPLIRGTITNIRNLGPANALTGPIARGDADIVRAHLTELYKSDPARASLYAALGLAAIPLARDKGAAEAEKLNALQDLFTGHSQ